MSSFYHFSFISFMRILTVAVCWLGCLGVVLADDAILSIYSETQSNALGWSHVNVVNTYGAYTRLESISDTVEGHQAIRASAQYPWGGRVEFTLSEEIDAAFLNSSDTWIHFTVRDRRSLQAAQDVRFGLVDTYGNHIRFGFTKYVNNRPGFEHVSSWVENLGNGYFQFHLNVQE